MATTTTDRRAATQKPRRSVVASVPFANRRPIYLLICRDRFRLRKWTRMRTAQIDDDTWATHTIHGMEYDCLHRWADARARLIVTRSEIATGRGRGSSSQSVGEKAHFLPLDSFADVIVKCSHAAAAAAATAAVQFSAKMRRLGVA